MTLPLSNSPSAPRARWKDLSTRTLSAALLAPLFLACLWVGGWFWWTVLFLLFSQLMREWLAMARPRWGFWAWPVGFAYTLAPTCGFLFAIRQESVVGLGNALFVVLLVWAADIGAYLFGRLIGGPKLAPAISPGKTWSGALGGLLCAALVGLAAARLSAAPMLPALLIGAGLGIVSELGDLLESAIKRHFGVKDSGTIIPGHGGLLDRLDALLAVATAAIILVLTRGPGVEIWR